jgi:TetR/AcrR family transcriptional repressor of bet genes
MSTYGYHGASINKIAKEAALAPGLILYHFESKQDILLFVVDELVQSFQVRYESRLRKAGNDPHARVRAFIDAQLALGEDADETTVAAWVVIAAQAVQNDEVRTVYSRSTESRLRELEKLLHADRKARGVDARGVRRVAAAILSTIEGSFLLSCAAPGTLPRGYAAPAVREMVDALSGTR